jgi:hypothetical protein
MSDPYTDPQFVAMMARSTRWEHIEYWAMLGVLLGVVGETIADRLRTYSRHRHLTKIWSERFLIASLAIELEATYQANSINNQAIAMLNLTAQNAAHSAAELGVKVDELPSFVEKKERELRDQTDAFRVFAQIQKQHVDAVVADLNKQRAVLAKLRAEAQAAAKHAEEELVAFRKESAPRGITPLQRQRFVEAVRGKVKEVVVQSVENDPEGYAYAHELVAVLKSAEVDARYQVFHSLFRWIEEAPGAPGLVIDEAGEDSKAPGDALMQAFLSAHIPATKYIEPPESLFTKGLALIVAPKPLPAP